MEVADGFLTVRAGRKPEPGSEKQAFDGYYRQFTLTGVRADKIGASYRDGLLTVRLPKARPEDGPQPRRIEIQ